MADLRLQVIMDLANRATAPLRSIGKGSSDAARTLKAARDQLKQLNDTQKAVGQFREVRQGLVSTQEQLRAAQERTRGLAQQIQQTSNPTRALTRQFNAARREATQLAERMRAQSQQTQQLRDRLGSAGISTRNLTEHERALRSQIATTTTSVNQQTEALRRQADVQRKLAELRTQHGRQMTHVGMVGASGAAGIAIGRTIARPLRATSGAFAEQEDAATQLQAAMMRSNGSVAQEFAQITALANRLGDRLPGTTADFQDMMTMLIRQGMSAKTILGGLGESAAYLGVQLKMPVTEAAEFAAKMQDATRTSERDMMGLMDVIQRGYYLGVDSTNMLQGFTKMSPVMSILRKEGLAATRELAPFLVMMDQTGMAGESAGNAVRKVFQATLDAKKLGKANDALADAGVRFRLDFSDGKGEFGGIDKLFAQIKQLNRLDSMQRTGVIKALFGDDAETLQVLNTLMSKGVDGYREVQAKMQDQAELRQRVDKQLGTLTNLMEAAQGSFINLLAQVGETFAPALKEWVEWLSGVTSAAREWVAANPRLVASIVKVVAVLAVLYTGIGALMLAFAGIVGPMLITRFLLAQIGVRFSLLSIATRSAGAALGWLRTGIGWLARVALPALWAGLVKAGTVLLWVTRALMFTPIGRIIALVMMLASAAIWVWRNWDRVRIFFAGLWRDIVSGLSNTWQHFKAMGGMLIDGLVGGVKSRLGALRDAITGAASGAISWFKEKLGIQSPSRVFLAAGENIGQGAAMGIARSTPLVRHAATSMVAATALAMPGMATADPSALRFDQRAPLAAGARQAPVVVQGDTITFHITVAPGADDQALVRAIGVELDRRERAKAARTRSALSDIH